jgi:hypothetical protein
MCACQHAACTTVTYVCAHMHKAALQHSLHPTGDAVLGAPRNISRKAVSDTHGIGCLCLCCLATWLGL